MAAFSKKQYEILKQAIVKARLSAFSSEREIASDKVALEIGLALQKDNRQFDLARWMWDIRGHRSPRFGKPVYEPNPDWDKK